MTVDQNRLMKRRCARALAHYGRATKTELTCNLIDSVLEERTHLQAETEKGSARGGELGGALPRQEGIHRHHGIPARTRTRR